MNRFEIDRIQCFDCGLIRAFPAHIEWDSARKVYACTDRLECAAQPERPALSKPEPTTRRRSNRR